MLALPPRPAGGPAGWRCAARRQVLAALARRVVHLPIELIAGSEGIRRLAGTPLFASVSERDGWVAAVLSPHPVGIDIESRAEAAAGAAAVLGGVDVADLAAWHGPGGVWAAREAVLKACGRDLTDAPERWSLGAGVAAAPGIGPHRVDLSPLPEVVAAVAYVGG